MKKVTFLLLAIFSMFLYIDAAVISVEPGNKVIFAAIAAETTLSGDTLELSAGEYTEGSTITFSKNIYIRAAKEAHTAPVIKLTSYFRHSNDFGLEGVVVDGNNEGNYAIRTDGSSGVLKIIDSTLKNFTGRAVYLYGGKQIDSLIVSNCVFDTFDRAIQCATDNLLSPGGVKHVKITNSTFANMNYAVDIPDHDSNLATEGPEILIDHCTMYNIGTTAVRLPNVDGAVIKNCIVSNPLNITDKNAFYVYGENTQIINCIYHNTVCYRSGNLSQLINPNTNDPLFFSPDTGDFSLQATSPAIGAADDGLNIGDIRWGVVADELNITMTSPGEIEKTSAVYQIKWVALDPDGDAEVTLHYSTSGTDNWILIAENLSALPSLYEWNVRRFEAGNYYIRGTISNSSGSKQSVAAGQIQVVPDIIPPRSPINMTGSFGNDKIALTWQDPTVDVPVEEIIDNFESGIESVTTQDNAAVELTGGFEGAGLKINYDVTIAWKESGAFVPSPVSDLKYMQQIQFRYKGDGSGRSIRFAVVQTDGNWWYTEAVKLNSTEWQLADISVNSLRKLPHQSTNNNLIDMSIVESFAFVISGGELVSGSFVIDDIEVSGVIPPCEDYEGTKLVRRTDRFPADHTDGDVIYDGNTGSWIDENIQANGKYYYAAFTYDDLENYSPFDENTTWVYDGTVTGQNEISTLSSLDVYPNPFSEKTIITFSVEEAQHVSIVVYNMLGNVVESLIDNFILEGKYSILLFGSRLETGIYFIRMNVGNREIIQKIIFDK